MLLNKFKSINIFLLLNKCFEIYIIYYFNNKINFNETNLMLKK